MELKAKWFPQREENSKEDDERDGRAAKPRGFERAKNKEEKGKETVQGQKDMEVVSGKLTGVPGVSWESAKDNSEPACSQRTRGTIYQCPACRTIRTICDTQRKIPNRILGIAQRAALALFAPPPYIPHPKNHHPTFCPLYTHELPSTSIMPGLHWTRSVLHASSTYTYAGVCVQKDFTKRGNVDREGTRVHNWDSEEGLIDGIN